MHGTSILRPPHPTAARDAHNIGATNAAFQKTRKEIACCLRTGTETRAYLAWACGLNRGKAVLNYGINDGPVDSSAISQ
jgi:hypothetical protein